MDALSPGLPPLPRTGEEADLGGGGNFHCLTASFASSICFFRFLHEFVHLPWEGRVDDNSKASQRTRHT